MALTSKRFQSVLTILNMKIKEWRQEEAARIIQHYWKSRIIGYFEIKERFNGGGINRRIFAYDGNKNIYGVILSLDNKHYSIIKNIRYNFARIICEYSRFGPTYVSMTHVIPIRYSNEDDDYWLYDFTLDPKRFYYVTSNGGYSNSFKINCHNIVSQLKIV